MIPYLYDGITYSYQDICSATAEKGLIGALKDATRCIVTQEINGSYDLQMTYPATGLFAEYLHSKQIIGVDIPTGDTIKRQFFIVSTADRKLSTIEVLAYHVSYEATWMPVIGYPANPITSPSEFCQAFGHGSQYVKAYPQQPFVLTASMTSPKSATIASAGPQSLKKYMLTAAETYGGEWDIDNLACTLKDTIGADRGFRISNQYNMTDYDLSEDYSSSYQGIIGYFKKEDGSYLYGSSDDSGSVTPSGLWRYDSHDYTRYISKDLTDAQIIAQLQTMARQDVDDINATMPQRTIKAAYIGTPRVGDHRIPEQVRLGDIIYITNALYDDGEHQARVYRLEYDVLIERNASIELSYIGSDTQFSRRNRSLAKTISDMQSQQADQQQQIDDIIETGGGGGTGGDYETAYRILAYGESAQTNT